MKLSLNWLKEYVDLKGQIAQEVGDLLTLHTCELEEVLEQTPWFERVYSGKLLSVKTHPDADKLSVALFDLGKLGKKQIIFGQVHEVAVGEILPIALGGCTLKSGVEIKDGDIRGQKSEGMIADNQELGMKNPGLIRFPSNTPLGKPLPELCSEFGDSLLDIDNKSLTHRPDLMGHEGFARELKAIYKAKLKNDNKDLLKPPSGSGKDLKVDIQTDHCRRFCGIRMDNVTVEPSPLKTQVRLENLGVRAISNFVDITNLVMMNLGQPMHVFDADKVEGKIIVRQAKKGETLVALDEEEYELGPEDTVVADEKKVLSVAGIMGGLESGVTENTTNVIFECANWDPVAIRKTSTRLGLRSDSSMRYEKSLDPENCSRAIALAVKIAQEVNPKATLASKFADNYPHPWKPKTLKLSTQLVRDRIGVDIKDKDMADFLNAIDFNTNLKGENLVVDVPSFRDTKDINIAEDLIEEIVRMYGFDKVPTELPHLHTTPPPENLLRSFEWKLRDFWATCGYLEVLHYSYVPENDPFTDESTGVRIANPLSDLTAWMRQSLLTHFVNNMESEIRTHGNLAVFELGRTYHKTKEALPVEKQKLGIFQASIDRSAQEMFQEIQTHLTRFTQSLGVTIEWGKAESQEKYVHPGQSAEILVDGTSVGLITSVHPSYVTPENAAAVFADIDVEKLLKTSQDKAWEYQSMSPYPAVRRDIAVVVDQDTRSGDIAKTLHLKDSLVTKVELFDEFADEAKLGAGKKNLAFHVTFQSPDQTLNDTDIEPLWKDIESKLKNSFNAEIRE